MDGVEAHYEYVMFQLTAARRRLGSIRSNVWEYQSFNSQPPEGGWQLDIHLPRLIDVSTHSRPKAAGSWIPLIDTLDTVSTHSRPKAAGTSPCHPA